MDGFIKLLICFPSFIPLFFLVCLEYFLPGLLFITYFPNRLL